MSTWNPDSALARRHERRLFQRAQPLIWLVSGYARRRNRDVCRVPGIGYFVSGSVATREVMLDQETYSHTGSDDSTMLATQVMGPHALVNMGGDEHRQLRRSLQDLFSPKYTEQLSTEVLGGLVTDLHDRLAAGETVDLARFAQVLTGSVVCHLNGLRLEGEELERVALRMTGIGTRLANLVPVTMDKLDPKTVELGKELLDELLEGVEAEYHRGDPTTIPGRLRSLGLPYEQARGVVAIIILAGTETTSTAISRTVAMLHDTDQWGRLRANPELMDTALDELLRVITPVPAVTRTVARDHVFHGVRLRRNRLLVAFMSNAVRDTRVIDAPSQCDIARSTPKELRHIWFGAGPHFCLGFAFARRELTMVLDAIRTLDREIEIVDRRAARKVLLPSYERLEIRQRTT
ncbi:MAG: cytochrome [Thermoleophilia bacterium]|nr:cytochrome [Thermoleophilia bacterium]MCZ4496685.1 cytochrome [Thermoleophilia bacterium]